MSEISQRNGQKNTNSIFAQCSKDGKGQKIFNSVFFFTPVLRQDYKNVVFPRGVVKYICVQLARYIQDSFCHLVLLNIFRVFLRNNIAKSGKESQL